MSAADPLLGRTLLHYRLLERVGGGGMGEVYRAEDEKLRRAVAVKILPPSLMQNPARTARFEREARVMSALSHPHIAAIYEVGEAGGLRFIAMEFVEGEGLSRWLARERRSLPEILQVMEQVGDALMRAHEAGVLHRDLKPQNIMITRDGYAKLLDFGLAKHLVESDVRAVDTAAETQDLETRAGIVVGTMAYMSPEQAKSHAVDRRSDIFAYGIVLYEAVAGVHPFPGTAGLESVAAVLRDDPIPALRRRTDLPAELIRIIAKALEKEPARRYQFMDDLVVDLRSARRVLESGSPDAPAPRWKAAPWAWLGLGVAAGFGLAWVGGVALSRPSPREPLLPIARPGVTVRPLTFSGLSRDPWISSQGDRVCYASDRFGSFDIFLQDIATGRAVRVTDDPGDELEPSFSPDGQTIAFVTGDGKLQTVPALGGPVRTMTSGGAHFPVWSPDGERIAYRGGLVPFVVHRSGGEPMPLAPKETQQSHRAAWSPDGRWLVFPSWQQGRYVLARVPSGGGRGEVVGNAVQSLGAAFWSADGAWLVGSMGPPRTDPGEIWSVPVERTGVAKGPPTRIHGGVLIYRSPSLSRDARRMAFALAGVREQAIRISFEGGHTSRLSLPADLTDMAVSPDGGTIALMTKRAGHETIWRAASSGGVPEPLGEGSGNDEYPAWSIDGSHISFSHFESGSRRLGVMSSRGGPFTLLSEPQFLALQSAWSPDGRWIAFVEHAGPSLRVVSARGGASRRLADLPGFPRGISWSPDGHWIVSSCLQAEGEWRLFMIPATGGPARLALSRARNPLWLPDGRIVFLRESQLGALDLWGVRVAPDGTVGVGSEEPWTSLPRGRTIDAASALSSDGRSVYMLVAETVRSEVWLAEAP